MPVTATQLATNYSDSGATSYNTASVSPTANHLILIGVFNRVASGTANEPTISGNGLTWVKVLTLLGTGNTLRLTVFRAMGASPSSGAITIDCAGQTQTSCYWSVTDFANVDTTGTNGSGAVVQSASAEDTSGTATSITVTLAAFGDVNNATYGISRYNGSTITPGSGFSELGVGGTTLTLSIVEAEWKNSNDTSVDWSFTATGAYAEAIAVEIKYAAAATGGGNFFQFM